MKRFLFAALACIVAVGAFADPPGDYIVAWTAPTERTNNAPVTPDDIANYKVYESFNGGAYSPISTTSATSMVRSLPIAGTFCWKITANDDFDQESAMSLVSVPCRTIVVVPPPLKAPTSVTSAPG